MSFKYRTAELCDFMFESDNCDVCDYGKIIAIRIDGDNPFPHARCYHYKNKNYFIFAVSDLGCFNGHELPPDLDYKNPYNYSFILPPDCENKIDTDTILNNFYEEIGSCDEEEFEDGVITLKDFNIKRLCFISKKEFKEIDL